MRTSDEFQNPDVAQEPKSLPTPVLTSITKGNMKARWYKVKITHYNNNNKENADYNCLNLVRAN